jgi:hypothetical protein
MSNRVNRLELVIAFPFKNLNPTILNPDLLKYRDIVMDKWELGERSQDSSKKQLKNCKVL